MPRQKKLRTGLLAALSVAMLSSGGLVAVGLGAASGAEPPDLVPYLPGLPNPPTGSQPDVANLAAGTPHPRFMDTVQDPGHTLLRFDTVLKNVATSPKARLDVFRTGWTAGNAPTTAAGIAEARASHQKIWTDGEPLDDPRPDSLTGVSPLPPTGGWVPLDPSPPAASTDQQSPAGHDFFFYAKPGHDHFHIPNAAQYQLVSASDHHVIADSPKNGVGFCLFDSFGSGDFASDPCHHGDETYTDVIREGISPGQGDLYGSGLTDQWVDVTNVMPGEYAIKAVANPDGVSSADKPDNAKSGFRESDYSNNTLYFPITIGGAAPASTTASTAAGASVDVPLSAAVYYRYEVTNSQGQAVNDQGQVLNGSNGSPVYEPIPNRVVPESDPSCGDNETADLYGDNNCFGTNPDPGKATFTIIPTGTTGGTAKIVNPSGTKATLRFTPTPGFSGQATVSYTATDARGLVSPPATATIQVGSGGVSSAPPGTTSGKKTTKKPTQPHFTLSANQLLINQRIGQAAIRRLNAVAAKLDGRPAPAPPKAHKHGTVTLSAAQLLINQRIYQAAIRRAAALEARLDHKPAPRAGSGKGGTVHLTLGQLIINQRIAQAAVRRANALVARVS